MKMFNLFITCMIIQFSGKAFAQAASFQDRIVIGDRVSHIPLMGLVNFPKKNTKISDFAGKILIFDYWFTSCKPCIASWPKLSELQREFEGKIQIILVNHMESEETVRSFIEKRNKRTGENFSIPSVSGDTVLFKAITPAGYPSIVWIDANGIYRGKTGGGDLNAENIRNLLNDKISFKTLVENTDFFDGKAPMFINNNGGSGKQMLWFSTFSGYSDEIPTGLYEIAADSSGYYVIATNKPIIELIRLAYSDGPFKDRLLNNNPRFPLNRIEFQCKDTARFFGRVGGITTLQNLYSYQLISYKKRTAEKLKEAFRDDLESNFDINLNWKTVNRNCLVLTAEDTTLISDFVSNYGVPMFGCNADGKYNLIDVGVDNFLSYLEEFHSYGQSGKYPLVDGTGFKGALDLVFDNITCEEDQTRKFRSIESLNEALSKYKMKFIIQERSIDILVVSDADNFDYEQPELTEEMKTYQAREMELYLIGKASKEKDWKAYQNRVILFVNTYLLDNRLSMSEYALAFYENKAITDKKVISEAIVWARRSIQLSNSTTPSDNAIYSLLLFKLGDTEKALEEAKKAMRLYELAGDYTYLTTALEEKIKEFEKSKR